MKNLLILTIIILLLACKQEKKEAVQTEVTVEKSTKQIKEELTSKGFQIFDYVDVRTQDTILMQQYFIAFLKEGKKS